MNTWRWKARREANPLIVKGLGKFFWFENQVVSWPVVREDGKDPRGLNATRPPAAGAAQMSRVWANFFCYGSCCCRLTQQITFNLVLLLLVLLPTFAVTALCPVNGQTKSAELLKEKRLTRADLDFGLKQLNRMLVDRPMMKHYAKVGDPIWNEAIEGFAGRTAGCRVNWNPEDLRNAPRESVANHTYPTASSKFCCVRLRGKDPRNKPYPADRLWSSLIFEFYNMSNAAEFDKLYEAAVKGRVSRADWIFKHTLLEYKALKRRRDFFVKTWQPFAVSHEVTTNPKNWCVDLPKTHSSWLAQYWDPKGYPWNFYGRYFDDSIAPYLKQRKLLAPEDKKF